MTKIQSHVMLVLYNVMMIPSNVKKEIKEPPNVTKVQLHVMLILYNVRMVSSNVRGKKKKKGIAECDKSTVTFYVGTSS